MRRGFRNAEAVEAPGGATSKRVAACADICGATTAVTLSADARMWTGDLVVFVVVRTSADSVSQLFAGTADSTTVVCATVMESVAW